MSITYKKTVKSFCLLPIHSGDLNTRQDLYYTVGIRLSAFGYPKHPVTGLLLVR